MRKAVRALVCCSGSGTEFETPAVLRVSDPAPPAFGTTQRIVQPRGGRRLTKASYGGGTRLIDPLDRYRILDGCTAVFWSGTVRF